MSYMALYRKFRPDQFDEVKGQEHIVTTLKNQLMADRIGHAYLFCGTRGTGKTTVAKLFAKAVNCEHPIDGSPCGECASCKSIRDGSSMNVIEIDAASNNGVDNIREIKEQVQYSPTEGKYKVYIIDEVHMLSIGAFNALLKTLEEPPSYVIFILATTEAHKIPITILSRCQRYDFKRISIDTISKRLLELMQREQVQVEEKAIRYLAKAADGSMRDALSLLDQCLAFYLGQILTYDKVLDVLGTVDIAWYETLLTRIVCMDTMGVMNCLEEVIWQGKDLSQFITDFMWYLRNVLLVKNGNLSEDALDLSSTQLTSMKKMALKIDDETLMRYIRVLSELIQDIKYSTSKRVLTEVAFIKLCKPQMEQNYDSILDRLRQMEEKILQLEQMPVQTKVVSVAAEEEKPEEEAPLSIEEIQEQFEPATLETLRKVANGWESYKRKLAKEDFRLAYVLRCAKMTVREDGNTLCLLFPNTEDGKDGKATLERGGRLADLAAKFSNEVKEKIILECAMMENNGARNEGYFDLGKLSKMKMEVEVRED